MGQGIEGSMNPKTSDTPSVKAGPLGVGPKVPENLLV